MKQRVTCLLLCIILLCGCTGKDIAPTAALSDLLPAEADQIVLTNCHNGVRTWITVPEDIAAIRAFLEGITGQDPESGKGYYEGSYSITFCQNRETVFSMAFGDSDCFYAGEYGDGYPIRYFLKETTIADDVIPFFSQFDTSSLQSN